MLRIISLSSLFLLDACWSFSALHHFFMFKNSPLGSHMDVDNDSGRIRIDFAVLEMRKKTKRYSMIDMRSSGRKSPNEICKYEVPVIELPLSFDVAEIKGTDCAASNNDYLSPGSHSGCSDKLYKENFNYNFNSFLTRLKLRTEDSSFELSYNEREDLYILLSHHVKGYVKPSNFVNIMLSLSHLKQNTRSWDCARELALLCENMPFGTDYNETFSFEDIPTIYICFARMQARYDCTLGRKHDLMLLTAECMHQMNGRSVGDIIWALGMMNAPWKELPSDLKYSIVAAISNNTISFSAYTLSSVLWAVSKMGLKWWYFPVDVRELFVLRLQKCVYEMSPQQSSKVIWALGNMGAPYDELSDGVLISLLENVRRIKKSQIGNAVPAIQSLIGIAKTGIHWKTLDVSMRNNIWEQVERVIRSNNDRGIANAFWALGSLGSLSSEHPKVVREALFQGFTRAAYYSSSWGLCNMVWGFAKMGYVWRDFPSCLKVAVGENIWRIGSEMNAIDVSVMTWSLGSLMVPLDSSFAPIQSAEMQGVEARILRPLSSAIIRTLPRMKSQEVSSVIWGLSGTGIAWDSLPPALRWSINIALRRISDTMSPQDVANSAYGLTLLSFDTENSFDPGFRGAHDTLLNKLRKVSITHSSSNVELEQLRTFAHFYETFKIGASSDVIRGNRVPRKLLELNELSGKEFGLNCVARGSNLQYRVIEGLKTAFDTLDSNINPYVKDIHVDTEVSSFGGILPVDALICIENKYKVNKNEVLAILEIDGPQHYREDGSLRRVDLLKEFMYLRRHPKAIFCRIRWDEANKLGVNTIGDSLANQILQRAELYRSPLSGINNIGGKIVKNIQRAFVWGMRNDGQ